MIENSWEDFAWEHETIKEFFGACLPKVGVPGAVIYTEEKQSVIYRSKKGTFLCDPLDWLPAITSHIPNKGAQNVHYYDVLFKQIKKMKVLKNMVIS